MGGLVARYYIQGNGYQNDVDQLIFLGTPHMGSPKSYLINEGGYFPGGFIDSLMKYIFQIEATENAYLSLPKYINEKVLSVKQLFPVYSYLKEKNNNDWLLRPYPINYPENTFLELLNNSQAIEKLKQRVEITNIYSTINFMNNRTTLSSIKVIADPNIYDSKWLYGYPENLDKNTECLITSAGDGTVPISSLMSLDGVNTIELADSNHNQIVTSAQKDIIKILTNKTPNKYFDKGYFKNLLFIRVYSPVDFTVIAPDGKRVGKDFLNNTEINEIEKAYYSGFNIEGEFVVIPNPLEGEYKVELQGTGNGTYKLGMDILEDNDNFNEEENLISGVISKDEIENFSFNYFAGGENIQTIKEVNFKSMIEDINELFENKEIKKKKAKDYLIKKIKKIEKKYNDEREDDGEDEEEYEEGEDKSENKNKIKKYFDKIEKKLKFYLKKEWITTGAYDIIKSDINYIINNLSL